MSDSFDPNFFLNLSKFDESAFNDETFNQKDYEIDDAELLRELEIMSGSSANQSAASMININDKNCNTKFDINSMQYNDNDFNVDQVTLMPEDDTNPELLSELEALSLGSKPLKQNTVIKVLEEVSNEVNIIEKIAELKREAINLKRQGDLQGAKQKVLEISKLEVVDSKTDLGPSSKNESKDVKLNISPKQQLATPTVAVTVAVKSQDAKVYRDLFTRLQRQSALCGTISEFYASCNKKSDANLFSKRKQAFDLDIQRLRAMLKSKIGVPESRTVDVSYEYMLINSDVAEGELSIKIHNLKIISARKCNLKSNEQYRLRIIYDIYGLDERESCITSEPFTVTFLENNNQLGPFVFKCNKKDIRVIKAVEHRKLKLEFLSESGFLFFKSLHVKSGGQCRLDKLTKDCTVVEEVDLVDVLDDKKRLAIPSAKVSLTAKIRVPLSSDGFKRNSEKWVVIPSFGNSNHVLYSDIPAPITSTTPNSPTSSSATAPQSPLLPNLSTTGTFADGIKSFEVIEYELGLLADKQAAVLNDPTLMDLQIALESLREQIQMQVELGQLSLEDYLISVKQCINNAKLLAIQSKKEGNLLQAQRYVKHVDIMRKEVAEAEANAAE